MSDVLEPENPPNEAKSLKELARQQLREMCEKYLQTEPAHALKPIELTKKDYDGLKKLWEDNQDYYKGDADSLVIIEWLGKPFETGNILNRVGSSNILIDYLKYLMVEASEKVEELTKSRDKDDEELKSAKKKFKAATDDYEAMNDRGVGGYKFINPEKSDCGKNLFEEREFTKIVNSQSDNLRLMHWNILADGLAGSSLALKGYAKSLNKQFVSPKECLEWKYRKWLILEEIAHYEPDIITLVELDGHQDYYLKDQERETPQKEVKRGAKKLEALQFYLNEIGYAMDYKAKDSKFAEIGTGYFWKFDKLEIIVDHVENPT